MPLPIKPEVARLLAITGQHLARKGVRAYLTGGWVRDVLLGRATADIDIAVAADALSVARGVAAALGGKYVPLDEVNGVGRVILAAGRRQLDFTTIADDITGDLARRDFTINAIGIALEDITPEGDFATDRLIDPLNGREDLRQGIVRAASDTAFRADAARLLRGARLAAEMGFRLDGETERLVRRDSHLIGHIAGERVREELLRLLAQPKAGTWLAYLDGVGLLTAVLPELSPARGVAQPTVHAWDVLEHSIKTVTAVSFMLREGAWEHGGEELLAAVPWPADLGRHFDQEVSHGSTRRSLLKLAALLHDVAKPQTKTLDADGRARFLGHPAEGAAAAAAIMERLRFSTREIKLVELLIKYHLRPTQMSNAGLPTRRAIYRYFRDTGEAGPDILFLNLADHLATRGPNLEAAPWREHVAEVAYVLARHTEEVSLSAPPKLVSGHDLMRETGLRPGPRLGELLEAVREAQAAAEVTTRQQALDYVNQLLRERKKPGDIE